MLAWRKLLLLAAVVLLLGACSPISRQVQRQTIDIPFLTLMEDPERYQGETVLLGGYIIQTRVQAEQTEMLILQTPLGTGDRPREKDRGHGRILVIHDGYLDPEVYARDRAVTVAGTVVGRETQKPELCPYPCLVVQSREIHLWREERYAAPYRYPSPYYDPFFYDPFWDYRFRSPLHRPPFWGHPWYPPYWGW
jgi:outer membrane lipoprotein